MRRALRAGAASSASRGGELCEPGRRALRAAIPSDGIFAYGFETGAKMTERRASARRRCLSVPLSGGLFENKATEQAGAPTGGEASGHQ